LGHYTFEECGDVVNPTLGLSPGQTYTFIQSDRSNFFHPLGIAGTNANETYMTGTTVIDKQTFEGHFVQAPSIWKSYEEHSVQVHIKAPDTEVAEASEATDGGSPMTKQEQQQPYIYYYCTLHHGMEGRIVLLPESGLVSDLPESVLATTTTFVDTRSDFDKACGTTGLGDFQLPNPLCPDRFICGTETVTEELQHFATCLDAANCFMMAGMTTGVKATDDAALFIHQMIPHHENAVQTAKVLLSGGSLLCPDLTDTTNPNCVLEGILREIVAGQNHQIQMMQKFLADFQYPQTDNCDVYVVTVDAPLATGASNTKLTDVTSSSAAREGTTSATSAASSPFVSMLTVVALVGLGVILGME